MKLYNINKREIIELQINETRLEKGTEIQFENKCLVVDTIIYDVGCKQFIHVVEDYGCKNFISYSCGTKEYNRVLDC